MTSPNLLRMARRAALDIVVRADFTLAGSPQWWVYSDAIKDDYCDFYDAAEATTAYLRLCESLESAETLPSAVTAADCSASCPPEGVR